MPKKKLKTGFNVDKKEEKKFNFKAFANKEVDDLDSNKDVVKKKDSFKSVSNSFNTLCCAAVSSKGKDLMKASSTPVVALKG